MSDLLTRCEICQSLLDEEDLFCANCGTESPLREKQEADGATVATHPDGRITTHNFECSGCGASMSFDAREGKLRCPFCGSVKMNRRKNARIMAPRQIVEFTISQDEAEQRMRQWLGRGFFLLAKETPRSFGR